MDAPKCRLCGKPHYGQCHEFDSSRRKAARRPEKKLKSDNSNLSEVIDQGVHEQLTRPVQKHALSGGNAAGLELLEEILARLESVEARLDVLDRRRKYQREYMRDKRK